MLIPHFPGNGGLAQYRVNHEPNGSHKSIWFTQGTPNKVSVQNTCIPLWLHGYARAHSHRAMNSRRTYQRVKTDDFTYRLLFSRMGSMQPYEAPLQLDDAVMEARRWVVGIFAQFA